MAKAPNMSDYFKARIDWHVNGMLSMTQARMPYGVRKVTGDVTDREIVVTMENGDTFNYAGGRYSSVKRNGCYAPLVPKLVK